MDYMFKGLSPFVVLFLAVLVTGTEARGNQWMHAHATFYGDMVGEETMQGACGYGNLHRQGYGLKTTALSTALFNDGAACGACYELRCHEDAQWCLNGRVQVTATNFCPPNYDKPNDNGGWCNPPRRHFDLAMPMFLRIAKYRAGIVPVMYRRVRCEKKGGMKFEIKGNDYWMLVLVYNVADAGNVIDMKIKGAETDWIQMVRIWGQNWHTSMRLHGQKLSFLVTTGGGRVVRSDNVTPEHWRFGQTFEGSQF